MRVALTPFLLSTALCAQDALPQPKELGRVPFLRSLESGLARAMGKPVLLLFQEVPG